MTESYEKSPSLNESFDAFMLLDHDEDWDNTVEKGIPLLEKLSASEEHREQKIQVRRTLERVRQVMQNSGAGDPQARAYLIGRIEQALR